MISAFKGKPLYMTLIGLFGVALFSILLDRSGRVGGLEIKSNVEGAKVFLDGTMIGTSPVVVSPKPGTHVLTVKTDSDADTYYSYEGTVSVTTGGHQKLNPELKPRYTEKGLRKIDDNFVLVKGGCFQMGDVIGADTDCDPKYEKPVHEVCLDDFYIGKYEVTQTEWQKIMGNNPSRFVFGRQPVESVSWSEVQEFIGKFNGLTGRNYRLPTEAEWEYAARSRGKKERWAGTSNENVLPEYAWYNKNSEGTTHIVGLKKPNELGIFDMTGNVEEFVKDGWSEYKAVPQRNPQGPEESRHFCMTRGGSFGGNDSVFARGHTRSQCGGTFYIGFRLARSIDQGNN